MSLESMGITLELDGNRFSGTTYISPWLRNALRRAIRNHKDPIEALAFLAKLGCVSTLQKDEALGEEWNQYIGPAS